MSAVADQSPNTGCLIGFRCPNRKCRSYGGFRIGISTVMEVQDEGVGEQTGDNEWSYDDYCECMKCGRSGIVEEFQEDYQKWRRSRDKKKNRSRRR